MVVCYSKKCIFIHIPKTAGTSIEQFIKDKDRNDIHYLGVRNGRSMHHYTVFDLKKELPVLFDKYYKFSIVRNPYDRLLSEYYWTPIPGVGYKSGKNKAEFLNYVSNVVKKRLYYDNIYNEHFIPQHMFIYNKKLLVDHLFRYEDLDFVANYLKKKLDIISEFPILNKSKFKKEDWNERQKERIFKLYHSDFILFNYSK